MVERKMNKKELSHSEICKAICLAQKIISDLHGQNNIEIKESYHLKNAFDELQEVFDAQFAKSCKPLINKIVSELLGVDAKVFKED